MSLLPAFIGLIFVLINVNSGKYNFSSHARILLALGLLIHDNTV